MRDPDNISEGDCLLTTSDAARVLSVQPATLKFWRVRRHRQGPEFVKLGSRRGGLVRYSWRGLMAYVEKHTVSSERMGE